MISCSTTVRKPRNPGAKHHSAKPFSQSEHSTHRPQSHTTQWKRNYRRKIIQGACLGHPFLLFCENILRWQLCLHYPTRCRRARGDFSWITGVQLEPRNFWKIKLPARHPNRTMDGRHATDMYPNGEDGRFLGLVEDETKPSIPPAGNPSKQASEDY